MGPHQQIRKILTNHFKKINTDKRSEIKRSETKIQNDEITMQISKFLLKLDLLKYSNINNNEITFIECKKDAIDIIDLLDKN